MGTILRGFVAGGIGGILMVVAMVRGISVLTSGLPVVMQALWERATRLMPLGLFSFFIVRFKFAAKPLAFWGMVATLVVGSVILGGALDRWRWVRRRPARVFAVGFVLVFLPLILLALGPASSLLASRLDAEGAVFSSAAVTGQVVLAVAAYAAIFAIAYVLVISSRRDRSAPVESGQPNGETMTRRQVLHRGFVLFVSAAGGIAIARWLTGARQAVVAFAQTIFDRVKGLPPEVTPTEAFYVVSKNPPGFDPVVNAQRWRLEISGLVGKTLAMSYDQIKAMPSVSRPHTLECISNDVGGDLISTAMWKGIRLKDVLDAAGGVKNKVVQIAFRSADGYTESIPLAEALHPDTLLVYEINGKALPPKHGFPLRLLVPGHFGMKNPKWITKIEAVDHNVLGYWERSGWSQEAVVKTMSKFAVPGGHMTPKVGEDVGFGGVAYSGDRGIKAVEISTDNGVTWTPASIKTPLGKYTWVLWAALWKPTAPGEYAVRVRATDGGGVVQVRQEVGTLPDGASGYHLIRLRVTS